MLSVAIVEDDREFARRIAEYLARYEKEKGTDIRVRYFQDGEDIVEEYAPEYDVLLMDIQMEFMSGVDAARRIREKDPEVLILFITNAAQFAIEGYEVRAFDYVLKPVTYETFCAKMDRALVHMRREKEEALLLQTASGAVKVPVSRILYAESQGHRMYVCTRQGMVETHMRMNDLEQQLLPHDFFRCHKGFLVNMAAVDRLEENDCLIGGRRIPVSRRKRQEFMDQLTRVL
ncbi:MAG: response regulator transcription factor [Lachnospiraceae bacterium]|nr:response regulator transcription factor [Lachnospiraceae bacterium]